MLVVDCEVFKMDWMVVWLDTKTRKYHHIVNDKSKLEQFYAHYKNEVMVMYNGRNYDKYTIQGILCGFDPYHISDFIINKDMKGFMYSRLLTKFPLIIYDCAPPFHSLKQLEALMSLMY